MYVCQTYREDTMDHTDPRSVRSPKGAVTHLNVLYDGGPSREGVDDDWAGWSVAELEWYEMPTLATPGVGVAAPSCRRPGSSKSSRSRQQRSPRSRTAVSSVSLRNTASTSRPIPTLPFWFTYTKASPNFSLISYATSCW